MSHNVSLSLSASNEKKSNEDDDVCDKEELFYQASPKCYDSLFCHPSPPNHHSYLSPICQQNKFQLNLNSAFDDALNQSSEKKQNNLFTFALCAVDEDEKDSDEADLDDMKPGKLTFEFL